MKKKWNKLVLVLVIASMSMFSFTACGGGILDYLGKEKPASEDVEEVVEYVPDEAVEETENTEDVTVSVPTELSEDLYSFQVSVDGTVYQFPMWASDFKALGWTYQGDATQTLSSDAYTVAERWEKDGIEVYTSLANLTMNSVKYDEAMVGGISFDKWMMYDCDWEIDLPKGIQFKVSSRDDIIAAYGQPTDEYDGTYYYNMTYEYDSYQSVDLYVYKDTGVLEQIEIRNFVELEGGDNSVDPTVPEIVKNYTAPTELGDDLYVYNIQLEGQLYSLPCPVSELLANGFTIQENNSTMEIGAGSYGWIELRYNNQSYRCIVDNYADYATIAENCFITTMESDKYEPKFDLVIPGGITCGDSKSKVLSVLQNFNYEEDIYGEYIYYTIYHPEDMYGANFTIVVENDTVISIEVSCE